MEAINNIFSDQAAGLRHLKQINPVQAIAVTAGKGGVGKTNVSVNLAIALAKQNKRVLLLDADLGLANIDVLLGIHAKQNISHVLDGTCALKDIILQGPGNIQIIPSSSGTQALTQLSTVEHAGLINAFSELVNDVDILIIDTAAGISDTVISFTSSSQENIVVVCDEPTSITDAYALIKVMSKGHDIRKFHILANMVRSSDEGYALFDKLNRVAGRFLDVTLDYIGHVSFDELLRKAVKQQKSVFEAYPSSNLAREFTRVAKKVASWPINNEVSGKTTFFLERLIQYAS